MPVQIPTDAGQGHQGTKTAFRRLAQHADAVEGQLTAVSQVVANLPSPLSLEQIRQALQAGGSHPLNLQNLQGLPATANPDISTPSAGPGPGPTPVPPTPPPYGGPCGPRAPHADTVDQAKTDVVAGGNTLATECDIYAITQLVVSRLQASGEIVGFLIKTTGANICSGHSISRVMYPDGSVWKILTDAGPGGANGPTWDFDGNLDLTSYDGPPCP